MAGWTKLQSSIVHSTIWREPNHVRIVWITILALCDSKGMVEGSVPGLADVSRVTLYECIDALNTLTSPDEWSRDPDNDGRRLTAVKGGWVVVNYGKYRDPTSTDRVRGHRERKKTSETPETVSCVTKHRETQETQVTHETPSEADTDPDTDTESNTHNTRARALAVSVSNRVNADFDRFWTAYPRKVGKKAAKKAYKAALKAGMPGIDCLVNAICIQKESAQWKKENGQYIPLPTTWLNQGRWEDELITGSGHNILPQEQTQIILEDWLSGEEDGQ